MFVTAPMSNPPAESASMTSRSFEVYLSVDQLSATAMKSCERVLLRQHLALSCQGFPISRPRGCADGVDEARSTARTGWS